MPKLTINGKEIEVPAGTNLIEAAKVAGADVPHYCYHPALSIAGQCRLCILDAERCILCSRCVRYCDEVTHTGELGIFGRGDHSEIALFPGRTLENRYSGNVIDICPVGALTDRDFRFQVRVWYLDTAKSVCNGCARGCNVEVHTNRPRPHHNQGRRLARIKPS